MKRPTKKKMLLRFLGVLPLQRKFLSELATLAEPLTRLTKKNMPYVWTEEQESSFLRCKILIPSAPMLFKPDFALPFNVHCDASADAGSG